MVDGWGGTFLNCINLQSVQLPNSIKEMYGGTFSGCENLKEIVLPTGLSIIKEYLFQNCKRLSKVTIPHTVSSISRGAFENCKDLEEVYCYASSVPGNNSQNNPFTGADIQYATLYVPAQSINCYNTALYWQDFKEIIAIPNYEAKKCAEPKISYSNGKLLFTCDTEGAQFVSEISDTDIKTSTEAEIDLSATYHIIVYATAPDYVNSDVVEATLCWIDQEPHKDGAINGVAQVGASPILVQNRDGQILIKGVKDGANISVYAISGQQIASTESFNGQAVVNTNLSTNSVAIVKIGEKSLKVFLK